MKKFKLILALAVVFGFIYSCNNSAVQKMGDKMMGDQSDHVCERCAKSSDAKATFENNSKTMQILFDNRGTAMKRYYAQTLPRIFMVDGYTVSYTHLPMPTIYSD